MVKVTGNDDFSACLESADRKLSLCPNATSCRDVFVASDQGPML
jgi:hypothetical protein